MIGFLLQTFGSTTLFAVAIATPSHMLKLAILAVGLFEMQVLFILFFIYLALPIITRSNNTYTQLFLFNPKHNGPAYVSNMKITRNTGMQ